LLDNSCIVNWK